MLYPRTLLPVATATLLGLPILGQDELQKIFASDAKASAEFGTAVAVSGDRAIVGARWDGTPSVPKRGAAYMYEHVGGEWVETQKLVGSHSAAEDQFGIAADLDGDVAVVGAWWAVESGKKCGEAYVFERGPSGWIETARLLPPVLDAGAAFGLSVAVSGGTVAVGARGYDSLAGTAAGAVFVYVKTPGGWLPQAELYPPSGSHGDGFGLGVDVDGHRALIGAPSTDGAGTNSGAVYVFDRFGSTWSQSAFFEPADGDTGGTFGYPVALDGDRALIGSIGDDEQGAHAGAGYVFELGPAGWAQTAKLLPPDGEASDQLGESIALQGDVALVGSRYDDHALADAGSISTFHRTGSTWTFTGKLVAAEPIAGALLGDSVAIDGDRVLAGAPYLDVPFQNVGAVHAFSPCAASSEGPLALLSGEPASLSLAAGGAQALDLATCPPLTGHAYLVLGTADPAPLGTPVDGVLLPLTVDAWFFYTLANANGALLEGTFGLFGEGGSAEAKLHLPAGTTPALAGLTLRHAFLAFDVSALPFAVAASAAVPLTLVP